MCGEADETLNHLISKCSKMALSTLGLNIQTDNIIEARKARSRLGRNKTTVFLLSFPSHMINE